MEPTVSTTDPTDDVQTAPPIDGKVVSLKLDHLDMADTTFRFRASLRVGKLKRSIKEEGQQLPIVVRKTGRANYQIISGFRRAQAMSELGAETISAIVRDDLQDDEAAFKASVLENTARKTYSDIDRAYVALEYKKRGRSSDEAGALMGLTKRQVNNIVGLLELPEDVQAAIDDPESTFSATHGLVLKQRASKYPDLDFAKWIGIVNEEGLSVAQLKRRINSEHKPSEPKSLGSIFNPNGTDLEQGSIRLMPVKLELAALSDEEKATLRSELEEVLLLLT